MLKKSKIWLIGWISFICVILMAFLLMYFVDRQGAEVRAQEMKNHELDVVNMQKEILDNHFKVIQGDLNYLHDVYKLTHPEEVAGNYLAFIRGRRLYDQIRFIDQSGMERLRVNYNNGLSYLVDSRDLQDKSDRYYFSEAIALAEGQLYVSPLDLNIEEGQVEVPYKPVIRLSMPVYEGGQVHGVVVINYLANHFLENFSQLESNLEGDLYLVNADSDYLYHNQPAMRWQFMFDNEGQSTFSQAYPKVWEIMRDRSGQYENHDGVFSFAKFNVYDSLVNVDMAQLSKDTIKDGQWYIISHIAYDRSRPEFIYDKPYLMVLYVLESHGLFFYFMVSLGLVVGILTYVNRKNYQKIKYHSEVDHLTQLLNRRAGLRKLHDIVLKNRMKGLRLSLCYIDINGLKSVNDSLGHKMGDELIKSVAQGIIKESRQDDFAIRLGGDEFLIAFSNVDKAIAEQIFSRIKTYYEEINTKEARDYKISVSHGIVDFVNDHSIFIDDLIRDADSLMYAEKNELKKHLNILKKSTD